MNSLFLLCYAPREAPIFWAVFWQSRKRGIVLSGAKGEAEAHFKVPGKRVVKPDDLLLYSLEVADTDGYWVEFSRPLIQVHVSPRTVAMRDVSGQQEGKCLADVPWRFFTGEETRDNRN